MKPIFVLLAFYVFVLLLLAGTSYVVFVMKEDPLWFALSGLIVLECKPKVTNVLTSKADE